MLELIAKIVYEVTGKRGININTDFVQDLNLNSFDVVNLVVAFEDYFDISIPTRDVWKMSTVRDVIKYFDKKGIKVK